MSKISVEVTKYPVLNHENESNENTESLDNSLNTNKTSAYTHEDELREKIEGLESNMVFLLNQLIEEKRKLNEVLQAKNIEEDNQYSSVEQNQSKETREHVRHLPSCPYSRIILEVDPNCIIHGHIYNDPNHLNPNSVLTNFSAKNATMDYSESNEGDAAGGDVNKEQSTNYLKLMNNFVPGDYTPEAREMLAYHLTRISQIGGETSITDRAKRIDHDLNILHEDTATNNDTSNKNSVELETLDNSETSLTNEQDTSSSKHLNELKEKYLKNHSFNHVTDLGNNTDKSLEYKDGPINSAYLENELDELNASMMEQGELDMLLKALKMSYYGSFIEDLPINLLGELLEKNK